MEEPHKPRYFHQMLEHFGPSLNRILFATDYPHWDADDPDEAFPVHLSTEVQHMIYFGNAPALYGLN